MSHDESHQGAARGLTGVGTLEVVARSAVRRHAVDPHSEISLLDVSENATFAVSDHGTGERSVLRIHRLNYHSHAAVASELEWLGALRRDAGVRTPRVLPARDGERIVRVDPGDGLGPRLCVRFEFLPGSAPAPEDLAGEFERLGAITARMHRHARTWSRPAGFTRFSWTHRSAFGTAARWGDWRAAPGLDGEGRHLLEELQIELGHRLRAYHRADRFGLIHADLRLANLLITEDQTAVIDFDDCGFGWYLYDLATALTFIEHTPEAPHLVDRWLAGYTTVADLDAGDRREIWTFVLFRRLLVLAWIASHGDVEVARQQGAQYTEHTCRLAQQYLDPPR